MPAPPTESNRSAHQSTLALLLAGVLSTVVLGILPLFVAGMAARFSLGDQHIGWLASADMLGSALASFCIIPFVQRLPWRPVACVAIGLVVAGNLAAIGAGGFIGLMLARILAGLGSGLLLSIAFVGLCRSTNPDRYFGLYTFAQLGLQALSLALLPAFLRDYGIDALFRVLAAIGVGSLILVRWFPRTAPNFTTTPRAAPRRGAVSGAAALALVAQGIYFLAPAATWGYLERIGHAFGLTLAVTGQALGMAAIAGIAGSALVVALGASGSRWLSMSLGTGMSIIAALLLLAGSGAAVFFVAAALFNFAWNFTFPYQMGALAGLDDTGAVPILSLLVQLLGLAVGPMAASLLNPQQGFHLILLACVGCYVTSLVLFRVSTRPHG